MRYDTHMKKKVRMEDEDRISKLPDELIHEIMLFRDTRFAVQTSLLSKRWKLVWTTLPFLNFDGYKGHYFRRYSVFSNFLNHVISRRNHQSSILKMEVRLCNNMNIRLMKKSIEYAVSHKVERLNVKSHSYCSLSIFDSVCLNELNLTMRFDSDSVMISDSWTLPNLTTLHLTPFSLRNLTIDFGKQNIGSCVISCSQLVNLKIRAPLTAANASEGKLEVLATKLCTFSAIGFFRMTFEGCLLENVNIKFWDSTIYKKKSPSWVLKRHQDLFKIMFSQLGSANTLTLDLVTLQALSELSDILVHLRCPLYKLKYLKLPNGCEESIISGSVRQCLLGASPTATIFKTLSQVGQIRTTVAGESNDRSSSSRDDNYLVSWRGHEVNSEFGGLLDLIMKRYPETFEQLPTKNKKIWTLKLNMLCSSVNAFTKTSKTEIDNEMLTEYRAIFTDLQRWGFNLNWLMSHLNHIEQVLLSKPLLYEPRAIGSRVDDAKSTLCAEKMTDLESSRIMGTNLSVTGGSIGDDIL